MDVYVDMSGRGSLAFSGVTAATKCLKVIMALNNAFHFRCDNKYGVISAILQFTGRVEEAAKYQYKWDSLMTHCRGILRSVTGPEAILKIWRKCVFFGKCVRVYSDKIEKFPEEKGELSCYLCK